MALLLFAPALAGCVGPGSGSELTAAVVPEVDLPAPVTVLRDAAGDATVHNSHALTGFLPCVDVRDAPIQPSEACYAVWDLEGSQEPAGVVPASPARDALEVRMRETPATFFVELDVASLEAGYANAFDAENGEGTEWTVWWENEASGCTTGISHYLTTGVAVDLISYVYVFCDPEAGERDNTSSLCTGPICIWGVPAEVEFGTPGTIRWEIPRRLLDAEAGDRLAVHGFNVGHTDRSSSNAWTEGPVNANWWPPPGAYYSVDRSAPGESGEFVFTFAPTIEPIPTGGLRLGDTDLKPTGALSRPDMHYREVRLEETSEGLRFHAVLDQVLESPEDHYLGMGFYLPGLSLGIGYNAKDGERIPFANLFQAGEPPASVPLGLEVSPGEPGTVTLALAWAELPPMEDPVVQGLFATTALAEATEIQAGGAGRLARGEYAFGDFAEIGGQVRLSGVGERPDEDRELHMHDARGDVAPPPDLTTPASRYDLLGVEGRSTHPDEMRFSLLVQDLSDLQPPDGYDAVFYGVAVEHDRGVTMVGHYRSNDRPGGEFLCAPDVTVLQGEPADPTQSTWTPIPGRVLGAASGEGGLGAAAGGSGGTGAASIVLYAPRTCFDVPSDAEALNASALKAGTYLIRRTGVRAAGPAQVYELDSTGTDAPVTVAFAAAPQVAYPWWVNPFGVENFWDILGVGLAFLTVLFTAIRFLRRRRMLQVYLNEIRRIEVEHREDAAARAKALLQLRARLNLDLERHRVFDSHYPIIMERLRSRLTSARINSIGDGFLDLPPALVLRIERLLDDGVLSREDHRALVPYVLRTRMPEEIKERLRACLDRWAAEDAPEIAA